MKALNTHIAITLRETWLDYESDILNIEPEKDSTDLFLASHKASRDDQYLWGYFGEYHHTHAGLGYIQSFPKRDLTKKQWKALSSKMRADERSYAKYVNENL